MAIPRLIPILTAEISHFETTLIPFINQALEHSFGTWSIDQVLSDLHKGDAQAFAVFDGDIIGCIVTTIVIFPERKAMHVPIVAGDRLDEWLQEMHDVTQRFAKLMQCDVVTGAGRRGWVKKLKALGWQEELVNISTEVK